MSGAGDSMFPDPPEPPQLVQTSAQGLWGGPSYAYRGARIECAPGGHVCGLFMPEHPLHGRNFGVVGTVTPLIDLVSHRPTLVQGVDKVLLKDGALEMFGPRAEVLKRLMTPRPTEVAPPPPTQRLEGSAA